MVSKVLNRTRLFRRFAKWNAARTMTRGDRMFVGMPQELRAVSTQRVLVLAPHMDDEAIAPGGTLARHVQVGSAVGVAFATDSAAGFGAELTRTRTAEAVAASKRLGFDILGFMNFPDGQLSQHESELSDRLLELIADFKPTQIFAPFPTDNHPDHQALAAGLARAIRSSDWHGEVWSYEVWSPLWPNVVVDITEVVACKKAAIECHASQACYRPYVEATLGLNRYRGLKANVEYAEAYFVCDAGEYLRYTRQLLRIS